MSAPTPLVDLVQARRSGATGYGRALRTLAGLTLQDAADRVGVTPGAVYKWETGATVPHGANASAYARFLAELRQALTDLEIEVPA